MTIYAQPLALGMTVLLVPGRILQGNWDGRQWGREFDTDRGGEKKCRSVRAAQYVRMSTEHQRSRQRPAGS